MKYTSALLIMFLLFLQACNKASETTFDNEIRSIENGLLKAVVVKGDSLSSFSIEDRMQQLKVPGASIAVVRNGKLRWAKGYGIANSDNGTMVDTKTLFQAGSISKPLAALAALKLVQDGKMELDTDINTYLKDWKLENNRFTEKEKVTLRRLLTHTAGVTVHGFPGYAQTDSFPSIVQVLNGEGNTPRIYVDTFPGAFWRYSGGGYTIMEKAVEDVSGMPLEEFMAKFILKQLGMTNSTYSQPLIKELHPSASAAYNGDGKIVEGLWHNYPEQAAAGLWTTPSDLANYCIAVQEIFAGKKDGVLSQETVMSMLTKHENEWGLGPSLSGEGDSLRFGHGGKNEGFTNNMLAFATTGDAFIVMTNGDNGGTLISEIMRSLDHHYNFGLAGPTIVELVTLDQSELEKLGGKYIMSEEYPGIGDFIVDLKVEGQSFILALPIREQKSRFHPLSPSEFIDLEKGDKLIFHQDKERPGFNFNNRYQFYKMD